MAAIAGIRGGQVGASIGSWDRKGVVPSSIDLHVDPLGHVAVYAICAVRSDSVSVMRLHYIGSPIVATRAECVAFAS